MKPDQIEALSFEIIEKEAGPHSFALDQWRIVQRMIHTTADFEFLKNTCFHPGAVEAGLSAIRQGKTIITDTNMAKAGIRKKELKLFGVNVRCFIDDPEVKKHSIQNRTTRAEEAVDIAVPIMNGGIYVVGNAPTALLRIIKLVNEKKVKPALIIGLPVGFVNAAESKAKLIKMDYPYISNRGRKGGSNVAASVVNALTRLVIKG